MRRCLSYARCTAGALALLLSPAIVIFIVPFAIGIVTDIVATAGPARCAVAFEAMAALLLVRCLRRQGAPYPAAKSIT